ncbi:MAG: hypothetical protein WC850_02425 [Candidatus Gracilibacteria bacterium]
MKRDSYELLDDGFVNLYEKGIFVRCFEWSAILVSEITGYRLFANINKKTGFIFLEMGFPKNKLDEIIKNLEIRGYYLRIIKKDSEFNLSMGDIKLEKNREKLIKLKQRLIKI